MPQTRHAGRRTIRRILDRNATTTADVTTAKEVAPVGLNHRLIEPSEECDGQQLLVSSNSPGVAVAPGSPVQVLNVQGGAQRSVIEAPPAGIGSPQATEGDEEVFVFTLPGTHVGYIAIEEVDSTHFRIGTYDTDLGFLEVLHNSVTVGTGTVGDDTGSLYSRTNGKLMLLCGDADLPDNSIVFFSSVFGDVGPWYVNTINIETGAVNTSAAITLKSGYDSMRVLNGIDYYMGKIRFLVRQKDSGPSLYEVDIYEVDTLLTTVNLVHTVDYTSVSPTGLGMECWARIGGDAHCLVNSNGTTTQDIIKVGLLAASDDVGASRDLPVGITAIGDNAGLHSSDGLSAYFLAHQSPGFSMAFVKVPPSGNATDEGWPSSWATFEEDAGLPSLLYYQLARLAGQYTGAHLARVKPYADPLSDTYQMLRTDSNTFTTTSPAPVEAIENPAEMSPTHMLPTTVQS